MHQVSAEITAIGVCALLLIVLSVYIGVSSWGES